MPPVDTWISTPHVPKGSRMSMLSAVEKARAGETLVRATTAPINVMNAALITLVPAPPVILKLTPLNVQAAQGELANDTANNMDNNLMRYLIVVYFNKTVDIRVVLTGFN